MGARNRVEIWLSYRPARLHRLAEFIPWDLFVADLLWRPGLDSQPSGPVRNPICRTGPPGSTGWRNSFLGICLYFYGDQVSILSLAGRYETLFVVLARQAT
jgi:hypothetical protein